jgi:hypothetical protein
MEKREPKEQTLESQRLQATLKKRVTRQWLQTIAAAHVGAQPCRRLICHLDAVLQDVDRELGAGEAGHPQPEEQEQTNAPAAAAAARR